MSKFQASEQEDVSFGQDIRRDQQLFTERASQSNQPIVQSTTMAQSVPPGDIQTQPNAKIVFNAPYDDKHTYHIKVINSSARRIGYGIKTTNMKRLGVDPPCGVLDPKEAVLLAVSCDAFAYGQEDTNNDRITVEWTNTPDGAAKQFRREWFQGDGMGMSIVCTLIHLIQSTFRPPKCCQQNLIIGLPQVQPYDNFRYVRLESQKSENEIWHKTPYPVYNV
ncbi:unnamed protein product [Caenorhabditis angaria]|uniref:Major sperm protein n=1 Tax=Caenorhabditis angaria TaxID=860376 RepID=A0A9P1IPP3_9PELO|nr:unnamed protein product [Caenorhabditis angaria]